MLRWHWAAEKMAPGFLMMADLNKLHSEPNALLLTNSTSMKIFRSNTETEEQEMFYNVLSAANQQSDNADG